MGEWEGGGRERVGVGGGWRDERGRWEEWRGGEEAGGQGEWKGGGRWTGRGVGMGEGGVVGVASAIVGSCSFQI